MEGKQEQNSVALQLRKILQAEKCQSKDDHITSYQESFPGNQLQKLSLLTHAVFYTQSCEQQGITFQRHSCSACPAAHHSRHSTTGSLQLSLNSDTEGAYEIIHYSIAYLPPTLKYFFTFWVGFFVGLSVGFVVFLILAYKICC